MKATISTNSYNFTGLESEITYTLKVIVTDNAENSTESSTTITTIRTVNNLKEGDKVYYVDKSGIKRECIVLYDSSSRYGVQIITADSVDTVTLGDKDFNTSINSYNSALKTLYDKAQTYLNTTYASMARCVGSMPDYPEWDTNAENEGYYYYSPGDEYFADYEGKFKGGDENYELDYDQMENLNILEASENYWLASRYVENYFDITFFHINFVRDRGSLDKASSNCLFIIDDKGTTSGNSMTNGFRPVFTLKSEIKLTEGDGVNIPYTLAP